VSDYPGGMTIRPLTHPGTERSQLYSPFRSTWAQTKQLLRQELAHLNAKQIVLELDFGEADLRLDGEPRAGRAAKSPAVAISFESKHGPLRYACNRFTKWQDNVRAIALGLEALRKVDRYGIGQSGEQYRGWKAIENSSEDPLEVLVRFAADDVLIGDPSPELLYRLAIKRTHPDRGGSREHFDAVQAAREALRASGRWS
jgi:hypothetical protein